MSKKKKTIKVKLQSTKSKHFYTTEKNPKSGNKLKKKKYDPLIREHALYEEKKIGK